MSIIAPVSIGSLYIEKYFKPEDKQVAEEIMNRTLDAYVENVNRADWMTSAEKEKIVYSITNTMKKFIGYHDNLNTDIARNFYQNLTEFASDGFFNQAMALTIFNAEATLSQTSKIDWVKYSQPQQVTASFNSKDDSIQFPAGIIQDPIFDTKRPGCMNFGALGG